MSGRHPASSTVRELPSVKPGTGPIPSAITLEGSIAAYLGAGNKTRAIDMLEQGYAERDNYEINIGADPLMDPLRNEPRFEAVCEQVMRGMSARETSLRSSQLSLARR